MFVIPAGEVRASGVENEFLVPYVKSPTEFDTLEFGGTYNNFLFLCDRLEAVLKKDFQGANNWIKKFQNTKNKNGTETIQSACSGHRPFWYSLRPKQANIVTAINPYERFFFCFSETPFTIDQRLVAITVNKKYDVELIAALLNSVITFLTIEMRGTSRNLGALDLNANYFKTLRVLNPDLLSANCIKDIKKAFQPLKARSIKTIFEEVKQADRINFDKAVLNAFGIDETILNSLYDVSNISCA